MSDVDKTISEGKPKKSPSRRRVAIHEAGHVIAAVAMGEASRISIATIEAETLSLNGGDELPPDVSGLVRLEDLIVSAHSAFDRTRFLILMMGGCEAERHAYRDAALFLRLAGSRDDYETGLTLLRAAHQGLLAVDPELAKRVIEDELIQGRKTAGKVIRQHWSAVEAVADALVIRRTMERKDLVRVIEGIDPDLLDDSEESVAARAGAVMLSSPLGKGGSR